jgi:hypothetical protein
MKIFSIVFILFTYSFLGFSFEKGSGSEFIMITQGQKVQLSIYLTDVKKNDLSVEFHFGTGDIVTSNMWQQFHMDLKKNGPVSISIGFIKTSLDKPPERLEREHFYVNEGVQIQDFLFTNSEQINKDFVGDERVELAAGVIIAKHYKKVNNGQTVDFWISDQVKPIGLVKLVSKSSIKKSNNYSIELSSLLKNVKPAIEPSKSIPMSKSTKKLLSSAAK